MTRRRLDGDVVALAGLGLFVALRFAPDWLRGVTPYWGDLTYLHQPWRAYDAELLAAGRLPLWNPFLYFGMPQAASMQDGLFYPGSAPFFVFGFPAALALFEALHYWLAAALAYLWLRGCRLGRPAAFGGAALFAFSGLLLSREQFINHLAVLALAPAFALFFRRGAMLSLSLALGFLAGYPPFLVIGALSAWAVGAAGATGRAREFFKGAARAWILGGLAAAALAACLLLPAVELVGLSRRASGIGLAEALSDAFSPRDLLQWVSPLLVRGFNPAVEWWKCCYVGFVGLACAVAGAAVLPRRRAVVLVAAAAGVVVLILGGSNALSTALWAHLPPLRFIRYPGNTACLAALPLAALAAAGLQRARPPLRRLALGALCLELAASAWGAMPRAPMALLTSKGPLAERLQRELVGHRYMLSPRALETTGGAGVFDWRQRLYGLTNAPLKLRSAANFGEPLTPAGNYALKDRLYSASGVEAVAPLLAWLDVSVLLVPHQEHNLAPRGEERAPWQSVPLAGAASARQLSPKEGAALPREAAVPAAQGRPLAVERPREDAVTVRGEGAGWTFLAEPLYPGWEVWLETPRGPGTARALPALGPFQKVAVPDGPWALHWRYEPASFSRGLLLTLAAAGLLASYWYNRARKADES